MPIDAFQLMIASPLPFIFAARGGASAAVARAALTLRAYARRLIVSMLPRRAPCAIFRFA